MVVQVTAICLVLLCLVSTLSTVDGLVSCTPKQLPAVLTAEISSPEVVVNFDDVTSFDGNAGKIVSGSGSVVDVLLIGPTCGIYQGFSLSDYNWINTQNWYPENDASPDHFPAVNADSNGYCDLIFSEPIGYFSIRVAGTSASPAGIFIYDEAAQELNCKLIPWMGATGNYNAYGVIGFSSNSKNIKKIRMKDSYSVADLLRASRCPPGTTLVGSSCVLPCDIYPVPCNVDSQNCANVPGNTTADCTCKQYYTPDNLGGCTQMNCQYSSSNCNANAKCDDSGVPPFYSCTCSDGYTGNGYGVDGCAAIPVSPPVAIPVGTPQAVTAPVAGPTSEPSSEPVTEQPVAEPGAVSSPTTNAPVAAPSQGVAPRTKVSAGSMIVELTVLTFVMALAIIC